MIRTCAPSLLCAALVTALHAASGCGSSDAVGQDASPTGDGGGPDGSVDLGGDRISSGSARGLELDTGRVYWAGWLAGEVRGAEKDGSQAFVAIGDVTGPTSVALAGGALYALADESGFVANLIRAPADGSGGGETLDTAARKCCLAAAGETVYWIQDRGTDPDALMRQVGDAAPEEVEPDFPEFLALAGDALWVAEGAQLSEYPLAGGALTPAVTFAEEVAGATADAASVFALTRDEEVGTASLWGALRGSGDPTLLWSGEGLVLESTPLALDADHIYFALYETPVSGYASLMRVPRSGGSGEVVAARQPALADIELDDSHVFWTNVGVSGEATDENRRGRVMRATK